MLNSICTVWVNDSSGVFARCRHSTMKFLNKKLMTVQHIILQKSTNFHAIRSWSFWNICNEIGWPVTPFICATLYIILCAWRRRRHKYKWLNWLIDWLIDWSIDRFFSTSLNQSITRFICPSIYLSAMLPDSPLFLSLNSNTVSDISTQVSANYLSITVKFGDNVGLDQRSCSTSGPVSTWMGNR